jgi:hypothetical protein
MVMRRLCRPHRPWVTGTIGGKIELTVGVRSLGHPCACTRFGRCSDDTGRELACLDWRSQLSWSPEA